MEKKIQKLAEILISLIEEKKTKKDKEVVIVDFINYLRKKRKNEFILKVLKEVILKILEVVKEKEEKKQVILFLARKFDKGFVKELKEKLKKYFGEEKEIKVKIDESIIAGFLAKSNDYLIDFSVRGWLNKLRRNL